MSCTYKRITKLEDALEKIQTFSRGYDISQGEAVRLLEQCTATAYCAMQP